MLAQPKNLNLITLLFLFLSFTLCNAQSFEEQQKQFPRVRQSFAEKDSHVQNLFEAVQLPYPPAAIFIRIFKYEEQLELWAKPTVADTFRQVTTYKFCSSSGQLGPKRQQGDYQIPEGFYHIDRFNPYSNFYLSLGLNYPNDSDKILGRAGNLGGDIFIHGDCVTIGCVPITDDKIKEVYIIAVRTKSGGQDKIPVHIFPFDFRNRKIKNRIANNNYYQKYQAFWSELEEGYWHFEKTHQIPIIYCDRKSGRYYLNNPK